MTFMEAAAKAKDGNRAFYRKAWRQVRRERTTRVGLMFGWYERSWVADRRNPSIKTKTATGFKARCSPPSTAPASPTTFSISDTKI